MFIEVLFPDFLPYIYKAPMIFNKIFSTAKRCDKFIFVSIQKIQFNFYHPDRNIQ
jgi:hypothetical protein